MDANAERILVGIGRSVVDPQVDIDLVLLLLDAPVRDPRLLVAGATLVRPYKGKDIRVRVLADGFEYAGMPYRSLTAIARAVTGY